MEFLVKNFDGGAQTESMKDVLPRRLTHSLGQLRTQRPHFHVAPESSLELALGRNKQLRKLGRPLDQRLAVVRKRERDQTPAGKPAADFAKNNAAQKVFLRRSQPVLHRPVAVGPVQHFEPCPSVKNTGPRMTI